MTATGQSPQDLHFIIFQPECLGVGLLFRTNAVLNEKVLYHIFGRGMITVCDEAYGFVFIQFNGDICSFIHHSCFF